MDIEKVVSKCMACNPNENERAFRDHLEELEEQGVTSFGFIRKTEKGFMAWVDGKNKVGNSFTSIAIQKLKEITFKQKCQHVWEFTDKVVYKECTICKSLSSCTLEEALANYEQGEVELSEEIALIFHRNHPLCICGSKQLHYYKKSCIWERSMKCPSCQTFQDFKTSPLTDLEEYKEFKTNSFSWKGNLKEEAKWQPVTTEPDAQQTYAVYLSINNQLTDLIIHSIYVEGLTKNEEIVDWLKPYIKYYLKMKSFYGYDRKSGSNKQIVNVRNISFQVDEKREIQRLDYDFSFARNRKTKKPSI